MLNLSALPIASMDAAYLAGLIDGEGSICICKNKPLGTAK